MIPGDALEVEKLAEISKDLAPRFRSVFARTRRAHRFPRCDSGFIRTHSPSGLPEVPKVHNLVKNLYQHRKHYCNALTTS